MLCCAMVRADLLSQDQIQAATVNLDALNRAPFNLGVAPFIIWAGVAVVALVVGAVTTVSVMSAKETELEAQVDAAQIGATKIGPA